MAFDPPYEAPRQALVFFERRELDRLLSLYGRQVAAGEWRDYGIAGLSDVAVFSVFRRAGEQPLYRIEKRPALARRQGAWAVVGQGGVVLRRGHELEGVAALRPRPVQGGGLAATKKAPEFPPEPRSFRSLPPSGGCRRSTAGTGTG